MHNSFPIVSRFLFLGFLALQNLVSLPSKAATSDQLYVEVSALGSLDYFYDHKLGLQEAGKAMGVQTAYVGPPAMICLPW